MTAIKLGEAEVNTIGTLPAKGSTAPAFELTGADFSSVKLSDYQGQPVVLNIFPSVATGVCQASIRRFNEAAGERDDAVVVTVSRDLPFPLEKFLAAEGLENVVMTSAFRSSFGDDYQVTMVDGHWEGLLSRAVIVLDRDHSVVYTEQVPQIGQEPDYPAALQALDEIL